MIPESKFKNGKGVKLTQFQTIDGKNIPGRATLYGSVVFVVSKTGSSTYTKLFTKDGLRFYIMPKAPANGKVRALRKAAKRIAGLTDWIEANKEDLLSTEEIVTLRDQIYQILREETNENRLR